VTTLGVILGPPKGYKQLPMDFLSYRIPRGYLWGLIGAY